ncbi:hypothetical protein GT348_03285 [Aristophania vespae]|uniref:Lipoprotein n=1 Tax=Aristophania vespae TaxID=2697033 RepID=A0A6P1NEW8_9PROT|nr:hypothetical protein [Aristophania vespae]QHI95417.1 hypothetical protein GT348_03285 [Aristophania vespae]UMM64702.1 hypothetical protein DM15PD_17210 [Aristophania vespae]
MRFSFFCFSAIGMTFLAGCAATDPAQNAYGTWTGKLVTEEGSCPKDDLSMLKVRGDHLIFNPGMGPKVLRGHYKKGSQNFHAELNEKSMNNSVYRQVFDAYPVGQAIGGTYASPRCRARVTLIRR